MLALMTSDASFQRTCTCAQASLEHAARAAQQRASETYELLGDFAPLTAFVSLVSARSQSWPLNAAGRCARKRGPDEEVG